MTGSDLTNRQKTILYAAVREYCENNESIGSTELKERYGFDFSSATIRNELIVLREKEYLYQPFKNASSQPSEKALKLFINGLLGSLEVSNNQQRILKEKIIELQSKQTELSKEIAKFLAEQVGGVGFSLTSTSQHVRGISNLLKHPGQGTVPEILDFLENIEQYKQFLLPDSSAVRDVNSPSIRMIIGDENPIIPLGKGYALVSTEVELQNGEKSVVGLITPVQLLAQKKNLQLLDALNVLLNPNKKI